MRPINNKTRIRRVLTLPMIPAGSDRSQLRPNGQLTPMRNERNKGSVMLISVFVIALLSAMVTGILQLNTEEIRLMQNHIYAAQAMAVAEAGLNDALSELRDDMDWDKGFNKKSFGSHVYTVEVTGSAPEVTIESTGTSSKGFVARVEADVTIGSVKPYVIRIDSLRINE